MNALNTTGEHKPEDLKDALALLKERIIREEMLAYVAEPEVRKIILERAAARLSGMLSRIEKDDSGA